jgi:hypothetical protein
MLTSITFQQQSQTSEVVLFITNHFYCDIKPKHLHMKQNIYQTMANDILYSESLPTTTRGCIQKFPDWQPGARIENGTALCH